MYVTPSGRGGYQISHCEKFGGRGGSEAERMSGPGGRRIRDLSVADCRSLSSGGGGGEGRGEESRFYWISPLPNPLPARSSQGEGDRRPAFQCLIQWPWSFALPGPTGPTDGHNSSEERGAAER